MRLYPRTLPIFIFIPPLEVLSLISLTAIVKLISAALTTSLHFDFLRTLLSETIEIFCQKTTVLFLVIIIPPSSCCFALKKVTIIFFDLPFESYW
jgi:hypothetical protein